MHVIKSKFPKQSGDYNQTIPQSKRSFMSGSGIDRLSSHHSQQKMIHQQSEAASSRRSVPPPSTRRFANNYAAFYDIGTLDEGQYQKARALKRGEIPIQKAHNGSAQKNQLQSSAYSKNLNFVANAGNFFGQKDEETEFYKNFRSFYGGDTPTVARSLFMGQKMQEQQKGLVRDTLAKNAKQILNTKSFEDKAISQQLEQTLRARKEAAQKTQAELLADSGFDKTKSRTSSSRAATLPVNYEKHGAQGDAKF